MRASPPGAPAPGAGADVNSRSIGIELEHFGHSPAHGGCAPFSEPQMAALEVLLSEVLARWAIPASAVLGHSDVAPGRKIDPGEKFDWARLARGGLAEPAPVLSTEGAEAPAQAPAQAPARDPAGFLAALRRIGFGDWPADACLDAFRRRWRPAALGAPLEAADMRMAAALASRRVADS